MKPALKNLKAYLDLLLPLYANNDFLPSKIILEVTIEFGRKLQAELQEIDSQESDWDPGPFHRPRPTV